MEPVRIFVSHSGVDHDFSLQLIQDLRERFSDPNAVWYDRAGGIWAGDDWWNEIITEIAARDVFVVILSPDAMASKWVQAEVAIAWNQRIAHGKRILPLMYRATPVRADLATLDIISFEKAAVRAVYNAAFEELVHAITSHKDRTRDKSAAQNSPSGLQAPLKVFAITTASSTNASGDHQQSATSLAYPIPYIAELDGFDVDRGTLAGIATLSRRLRHGEYEIVHFIHQRVTTSVSGDGAAAPNQPTPPHELIPMLIQARILPASARVLIVQGFGNDIPIDRILGYTPYTVVIRGDPEDDSSDLFAREFYTAYALSHSAERAFDDAQFLAGVASTTSSVSAELGSRAQRQSDGALILTVHTTIFPDPLHIDLQPVEPLLDRMGMPRDQLFEIMAHKIHVHDWIFSRPHENAILPIGSTVLGVFTWDALGNIRCVKLIRVDENVDPEHWTAWCRLLMAYNNLCDEEYRTLKRPGEPDAKPTLQRALTRCKRAYASMQPSIETMVTSGFKSAALSYGLANTFLDEAETRLIEDDLPRTVSFLESALTSIHDIITACMPQAGD